MDWWNHLWKTMSIHFVILASLLLLNAFTSSAQQTTSDLSLLQYLQARLIQLEERMIACDQVIQQHGQKIYELSSLVHGQESQMSGHKAEVRTQVEGMILRVERLERDMEYVQNSMPDQAQMDMDEELMEQEMIEAQTERQKSKVTIGADCDKVLTGVDSMKIVKKSGNVYGVWLREPTQGKLYYFDGPQNSTLVEFPSMSAFQRSNSIQKMTPIQLPIPWRGTGHAVYNGFAYYHQAGTPNRIVKVNLHNSTVSGSLVLPGVVNLPVYELSPHTFLHLLVDEMGLWAIHSDPDLGGNLVMTKLNAETMQVVHSWDTPCQSRDAEGAFLICGTMYVVYNSRHGGRSSVRCLYDIHDILSSDVSPVLFFPKGYTSHASMQYYPNERQLFCWDDGYQTIYHLNVTRKLVDTVR